MKVEKEFCLYVYFLIEKELKKYIKKNINVSFEFQTQNFLQFNANLRISIGTFCTNTNIYFI